MVERKPLVLRDDGSLGQIAPGDTTPDEALSRRQRVVNAPIAGVGGRFRNITVVTVHAVPTLSAFQTDLDWYQEWNYTTVTCDDVWNHLQGASTLPAKPLLVTFDDGYNTQYAAAQELFSRGMKGVFYVCPGFIDGEYTAASVGFTETTALTWTQLNQMRAWGHDIQSHSRTHTIHTSMTYQQVYDEFVYSKGRLEAQVSGLSVRHHAYPYGAFNDTTKAALTAAGCRTARMVRCGADGGYPGPSVGRYAFATSQHDVLQLPTTGTGYADLMQPNFYHSVAVDEDLIPDYGFEAGGKGWTLGAGFAIDATDYNSGTRSMKCTQQTSTVSASANRFFPPGFYCRIVGSVRIKTVGLPTGAIAKVQASIFKTDAATFYQTVDLVAVSGNNGGWTKYDFSYTGDTNTGYLKWYLWLSGNGAPSGAAWWDDLTVRREVLPSSLALPF